MVKIPKDERKGNKILLRDERGRFVAQAERYQKATHVQRLFRGKYETVVETKRSSKGQPVPVTPKLLADLLPRDEFEELAPNYGPAQEVKPQTRKYTAWDAANRLEHVRGLRGHMVKITMNLLDGDRMRQISFFHGIRQKGSFAYSVFKHMNEAIGNIKANLYNKIGSKLLPDRKGRQVHLKSITVSKEL